MEEKNVKSGAKSQGKPQGTFSEEPSLRCRKCSSEEIKVIDQRKRGIIYLVAGIPIVGLSLAIAPGTVVPYLTIAYFAAIGLLLLLKKPRFLHVCTKCGSKVSP